mmetsp:Transcript_89034/g.140671  ORF Transcript_89034/g.140671 Transcript_89034/m.140671 type:complete len:83 (+) Transcript_89034:421-669(+)
MEGHVKSITASTSAGAHIGADKVRSARVKAPTGADFTLIEGTNAFRGLADAETNDSVSDSEKLNGEFVPWEDADPCKFDMEP